MQNTLYSNVINEILKSKHCIAFTGAGISVESGIPPFRGENGIWNKYDPSFIELQYFLSHPKQSWEKIIEVFYAYLKDIKPNSAHYFLSELEQKKILKTIITQNIDNLHTLAGNKNVLEFHGSTKSLSCIKCRETYDSSDIDFNNSNLPPYCSKCGGLLKPDFVFFSEQIPELIAEESLNQASICDCMILIGTSGVVYPAAYLPYKAKENNAVIIEINATPSQYSNEIVDYFIQEKAGLACQKLSKLLSQEYQQ